MYCSHVASCDIGTMRLSIHELIASPSELLLRLHTQHFLLLQLIVRFCKNAFCVFPHRLLRHANCVWILRCQCTCCCRRIPKAVFLTGGFHVRVYFLVLTRQCMKLVVFQVSVCSLKGKQYLRLTYERTFLRWLREVQNFPLIELPVASVCWICRCGNLHEADLHPTMIRGFNLLNQETLLIVWICATG
jgi:hypothetical protein